MKCCNWEHATTDHNGLSKHSNQNCTAQPRPTLERVLLPNRTSELLNLLQLRQSEYDRKSQSLEPPKPYKILSLKQ